MPDGTDELRGTESTERFMCSMLRSTLGTRGSCIMDIELAWGEGEDLAGRTEAGGGTKAMGITLVD
jgi:hypothetical protein